MAIIDSYVSNTGMTIEQKAYIDAKVKSYVNDNEPFWAKFFATARWIPGRKKFTHRKHVRQELTANASVLTALVEGQGATKSTIKVTEWEETVANYGTYIPYTREALQYNIDDVLDMCTNDFSYKAVEIPEMKRAAAMCTSNFTMAPVTTTADSVTTLHLTDTFDKAKVILDKQKSKPWADGRYLAIVTPEILAQLKAELRTAGVGLDEATKKDITRDGMVFDFDGFYIVSRSDTAMYETSGNTTVDKIVFICKTRDNELPGSEIEHETSIFDNGLGSGEVLKNGSTTEYEADHNKRVGSVAMNIDHMGVGIQADLGHLVCTVPHVAYTASATPTADPINGVTDTDTAPSA